MAILNINRSAVWTWRKLGSIHLTVALCLLLVADLAWGYLCLHRRAPLFAPLNDLGLIPWLETYGRHNLIHTAWFLILLGLLALLCVNTFICTTDRVRVLTTAAKTLRLRRLLVKLAPHIMHYAMIIILAGYLSSYLFARVLDTRTLVVGGSLNLPGTDARVTFTEFAPVYYEGTGLPAFHNRVLRPRALLQLSHGDKQRQKVLGCTAPVRLAGYGIFLKDYSPKSRKGGMGSRTRIDLIIRKDPGVGLYLAGIVLFSAGLAVYIADWARRARAKINLPD